MKMTIASKTTNVSFMMSVAARNKKLWLSLVIVNEERHKYSSHFLKLGRED